MMVVMVVRDQLDVSRASGRGRFGATSLLLLLAFFDIFGDTFTVDALATLAHVRPERSLLLLLAEGARFLSGLCFGFFLSHSIGAIPLLLLLQMVAALGRSIERVLQCSIRELLIVPVQWIPEGTILDTVAHVVHIHPVGERGEALLLLPN